MLSSSNFRLISSTVKHGFIHEVLLLKRRKLGKIEVSKKIDLREVFLKILNFSFNGRGLFFTQQLLFNSDKGIAFARHTKTLFIAAETKPTFGQLFLFNGIKIANEESSILVI